MSSCGRWPSHTAWLRESADLIEKNEYAVRVASYWELINKKERRDAPVKDASAWWDNISYGHAHP